MGGRGGRPEKKSGRRSWFTLRGMIWERLGDRGVCVCVCWGDVLLGNRAGASARVGREKGWVVHRH